ncbi:aspartate aminotransferase family protein [Bradyrhizobium sp. 17]|uniref:aspartate aminotransferase family protein n=1 Tax=Bradyrhizobium sp. 17 TaxID=2782649 RepID=UPI001FFB0C66|nr:aspartate aminotransferase family protein [Bradyrhizobium sp. 17]MCK1520258.1 aspartate aminotransferase family protein [Bradyrhizobium sp. 17]
MSTPGNITTNDKGHGHNRVSPIGPQSKMAFEKSKVITPGGSMRGATFFAPQAPYALRGEGAWVTDADGRRLFDCNNNMFSLIHGHAFQPVVDALHKVIDAGTAFGLPTTAEIDLAEELCRRAPRLEQVRFVNSGTEAVMFAIKAARAITGRPAIAKFEGAYHGAYDCVEVSLDPTPANWGDTEPLGVAHDAGTPAGVVNDTVVLRLNDVDGSRRLLEANGARLACVVFDPVTSRAGMVPPTETFRDMLQNTCRQLGILLVLDEVISFRFGYGGSHSVFGLEPDLVALGKMIGGGLPVGAIAGPAHHMAVFDHTKAKPLVSLGGTFSANPLTMVAGTAALRAFDAQAVERLNALGSTLRQNLNEAFKKDRIPAQVTGFGSLFRLHPFTSPITDYRSCYPSAIQKAALSKIQFKLLGEGLLLTQYCAGALSTAMSRSDINDLAEAIVLATKSVFIESPWS